MPECPGLHRLAVMRDGLMARLRVPGGRLTAMQARGVARIARAHGSGRIDLTNRANLQLRGLDPGRLDGVRRATAALGLLADPSIDRARNVIASPSDVPQPLVARLDAEMKARAASLAGLPVKAALVLDDGAGDVIGAPHDIGLIVCAGGRHLSLAGRPTGLRVEGDRAVALCIELLEAMAASGARLLGRDSPFELRTLAARLDPIDAPPAWPEPDESLGVLAPGAAAIRAALSGLDADGLETAARLSEDGFVRLAPGRRIVLRGLVDPAATLRRAGAAGFETRETGPRILACAGSTGCPRTMRDVRADAARLKRDLAALRTAPETCDAATMTPDEIPDETPDKTIPAVIHLTGCARGCARSAPASILLRAESEGEGDGYALYRDARADVSAAPERRVAPGGISHAVARLIEAAS